MQAKELEQEVALDSLCKNSDFIFLSQVFGSVPTMWLLSSTGMSPQTIKMIVINKSIIFYKNIL
jgi:hypothetical protein